MKENIELSIGCKIKFYFMLSIYINLNVYIRVEFQRMAVREEAR